MTVADLTACKTTSQMASVVARHFAYLNNPRLTQPNVIQCTRASMMAALQANDPLLLIHNRTSLPLLAKAEPIEMPIADPAMHVPANVANDPVIKALVTMETIQKALIVHIAGRKVTDDMRKDFDRFTKASQLAMRPGNRAEGIAALRVALSNALKLL